MSVHLMTWILLVLFAAAVVVGVTVWLKHAFGALAQQALERALQSASQRFAADQERAKHDLTQSQHEVDRVVQGLKEQLQRYEGLMSDFEKDRDQKYGRLEGEIKRVVEQADRLQQRTGDLVAVLGNSRVRGQWGQKMADDILTACGLQEGLHYRREQDIGAGRPDYTFLLPEGHQLFMDVKFPLDNYLKFSESRDGMDQRRFRDEFCKDVRGHLREMERRGYVESGTQALDYVVIFIPNEQVFSVVNEWLPGLIDESLQKRMILCGPWTLYAVIRIIWQAWQNYHYSLAIQDIVKVINAFMQDYQKFRERFDELGRRIEKVVEAHQEIAATSHRRLEGRIRQIEEYRKGQQIPGMPLEQECAVTEEESEGSAG